MNDFTINCENNNSNLTINSTNKKNNILKDKNGNIIQLKKLFIDASKIPTQEAVDGIKFDFNDGLRVYFPKNQKKYRCIFKDAQTDIILYNNESVPGCLITSVKKYYLKFKLQIYQKDKYEVPLFQHLIDLTNKQVFIQIPAGALGDSIAWFSYIERFKKKNNCNLTVMISKQMLQLFQQNYPDIKFVTFENAGQTQNTVYATYRLGLFFKNDINNQPYNFKDVGLHKTAGYILGLRTQQQLKDIPPRVNLTKERIIKQKYVVIASHSSSQCKMWNNPSGWRQIIKYLKELGYRVLCIDKLHEYGQNFIWNTIPYGCQDYTGNLPLQQRIDIIKDADFFIGLSSGLTWLAWTCNVPIILISGFTNPWNQFYTPYRIINENSCHGCWNDTKYDFQHFNFLWCPRKQNDYQKFQCTKAITPKYVMTMIDKVIADLNSK